MSVAHRRSPATVSACCLTGGSEPERLTAILALLRPGVDEIVVALDDRNADAASCLASVADRIMVFSHLDPGDRPIPWLFGLCRGDWIFNIDDDEVPSSELVAELPSFTGRTDLTHCWVARRWLYPDISTHIEAPPWNTEFQLRLVRRDARTLRFSDEFHRPVICEGPGRFIPAPLWHLDLAINPYERRLAKVWAYERARRGMRIGAYSHNSGVYLPELRAESPLGPVPACDLAAIERVLAPEPVAPVEPRVEYVSRAEIDAAWPGEPQPESLYDAALELVRPLPRLVASARQTIDIRVENRGNATWPYRGLVTLGVRWDGAGEGVRTELPSVIEPGESIVVPLHLDPPPGVSPRGLEIDLVNEHARWFGRPLRLSVEITSRRRVAVLGDRAATDRLLEALVFAPQVEPVVVDWGDPPGERYGHPRLEGPGPYLFGPDGRARLSALWRVVRLRWNARFREVCAGLDLLVITDDGLRAGAPPTREQLYVLAVAAVARARGLPVTRVDDGPPRPTGLLGRLLGLVVAVSSSSELLTELRAAEEPQTDRTPGRGSTMTDLERSKRFASAAQAEER